MSKMLAFRAWIITLVGFIPFYYLFTLKEMIVYISAVALTFGIRNEDYSENKIKIFLKNMLICLSLAIGASVFSFNIYIGTLITFIVGFLVYYFYTYENKISKAMAFMSYYVLILTFPIGLNQLPMRIGASFYGVCITFILYYLAFKKDFKNNIKNTINASIDCVASSESDEGKIKARSKSLRLIRDEIYNKIDNSNDNDVINKAYLDYKIVNLLIVANENKLDKENKNIISEEFLLSLKDFYNGSIEGEKFKKILDEVIANKNSFVRHKEKLLRNALLEIKIYIENKIFEEEYLNKRFKIKNILTKNSLKYNLSYKLNPSMKDFKFNHAIKGSILIALAVFVVYKFNIPLGKWILYTIIIDNVPFVEKGIKKARDRIFGTVLGFIAVIIIFNITQSTLIITSLIFLCIYVVFCIPTYDKMAIFITFSAIAGFTLLEHYNVYVLSMERITLVLVGSIAVYVVIKYIYPYGAKNSIENLLESFQFLNNEIKNNVNDNEEKIYELDIITRHLIRKGNFLSTQFSNEYLDEVLMVENSLILDLNCLYSKEYKEIAIEEKINKFNYLAEKCKENYNSKNKSKFTEVMKFFRVKKAN